MLQLGFLLVVALSSSHIVSSQFLTEYSSSPKPPINLYMDPNPPFYHGVTSGDPLPDSIILWTRATPRTPEEFTNGVTVYWRIWELENSTEKIPELSGNTTALPSRDWTVKVEAAPLMKPNTTYFYRFYYSSDGNFSTAESSRIGRTRTAPLEDQDGGLLTFAITSCSQHQMYQNTFAHLAYNMSLGGELPQHLQSTADDKINSTESIHALIDLGDWIYDTNELTTFQRTWKGSCETEKENAREPENRTGQLDPAFATFPLKSIQNCSWAVHSVEEWKYRHSLNHMDPDVRAARAAHPWIHMIDSHDVGNTYTTATSEPGLKVFEMWTPVRWGKYLDSNNVEKFRIYRKFKFGKLADVVILDTRNVGLEEGISYLGSDQRSFLIQDVFSSQNSTGWRIIATGKAFTVWRLNGWQGFATGVYLGALLTPTIILLYCCLHTRRLRAYQLQEGRNEDIDHYIHNDTFISGSDTVKETGGGNKAQFTERSNISLYPFHCFSFCGSKCCIGCGFFSIIFFTIAYIIILVLGSQMLPVQDETDAVNPFATERNWDGYPVDRAELMKDMTDAGAGSDNIFVSGDMHMLVAANVRQTTPGHRILNGASGTEGRNLPNYENLSEEQDKIGVEWLPSSTSSRNIDDFFYAYVPFPWVINPVSNLIKHVIQRANSQMVSFDVIQHGMGYLHLDRDKARMEFYRNDVFFPHRQAVLTWKGEVNRGENEWASSGFL